MQQDAIVIFSAKNDHSGKDSYDAETLNIEFSNVASTELFGIDLKHTMAPDNLEGSREGFNIFASK